MPSGIVKFFNTTRGYGFIQPDDGGEDVFFHISAVERSGLAPPNEGDKLSYDIEEDRQGRTAATNLRI